MRVSTSIAVVAAVFMSACAPLKNAPPVQANLTAEVATFLDQYLAAINARDAVRIRSAYVTDGRFVWIEDGTVRYRQVDEVLASLAAFPASSPIRTELTDLTVVPVGGSAAHAWASFKTTVGEGPRGFSFGGAISFALERDGSSWKLVGGHASSPVRR